MSDHFITLIPTDPYFVASADALRKARELLSTLLASTEQIEMHISDEVVFVDQGGNFAVSKTASMRELFSRRKGETSNDCDYC